MTDKFESSGDKKSFFVLFSGLIENGGALGVAKKPLLFRTRSRGSNESQTYPFLQFMVVTRPIDTLDKTLECVYVKWSTDDEVQPSLRRGTGISEQGGPRQGEWSGM